MGKKVWIFLNLSEREKPDKTRLTSSSFPDPLWFGSLCWWPHFSMFSGALCISFLRCSSLDIRLFTYAFSCSLSRSSRRILPILSSFLTFMLIFLDSLYAFYFLFSSVALSLSFRLIFTQNYFSTNLNYNNFLRLKKIQLCRYCYFASWLKIEKYWESMVNYNLTISISRSKRGLQIISLRGFTFTNSREALVKCVSVCPRYVAPKLGTRVCALHFDLPVSKH